MEDNTATQEAPELGCMSREIMLLRHAGCEISIRKIEALEGFMRQMPQMELPVRDFFSNGAYARELFIPKGSLLTGKIHNFENLNIMPYGDITVLTGDGMKRLTGYNVIVSPAGTKRVAYAHEDTVWTTVFGTECRDADEVVASFTSESFDLYLDFCKALALKGE